MKSDKLVTLVLAAVILVFSLLSANDAYQAEQAEEWTKATFYLIKAGFFYALAYSLLARDRII